MRGKVTEILLSEDRIGQRVRELATQISDDYRDKHIFGICLLKGSMVFTSDLIRALKVPITVDMMRASSYGDDTISSGSVKILHDLDKDIADKDVLIIEDIVDTGRTLRKTLNLLEVRHPKTLKICTLLDKPSRREVPIELDYVGFTIDDHFVVGYGLDFDEYYRDLPHIGILDPSDA